MFHLKLEWHNFTLTNKEVKETWIREDKQEIEKYKENKLLIKLENATESLKSRKDDREQFKNNVESFPKL
jgi:hypothetical protein